MTPQQVTATPSLDIAVFIDADNVSRKHLDAVFEEMRKYGAVSIRRAYGNWANHGAWLPDLHRHAIQPVQVFDLIKGKNASDIALVCDAMEMLHSKQIDVFCLVSSDCDFTPLVMKIRQEGRKVFGFGETKTPTPFVDACSEFFFIGKVNDSESQQIIASLEKALEGEPAQLKPKPQILSEPEQVPQTPIKLTHSAKLEPTRRCTTAELKADSLLLSWLREAVKDLASDDGWAGLGYVGSWLINRKGFRLKHYGFARLLDLFIAIDLFDIDKNGNLPKVCLRKPLSKPPSFSQAS